MRPIYIEVPEGDLPEYEDLGPIPWIRRTEARQECFMALEPRSYTYGSGRGIRTYTSVEMTGAIRAMAMYDLGQIAGHKEYDTEGNWTPYPLLNVCFLNLYADQHQHLGWHADDDPGTDHECPIIVVSYYNNPADAREICWRPKGHKGPIPPEWRQKLAHRSVFIMPPGMQETHEHKIPKHDRNCGPRVSLTFRKML